MLLLDMSKWTGLIGHKAKKANKFGLDFISPIGLKTNANSNNIILKKILKI